MSDIQDKNKLLDDFWDISSLVPKKKIIRPISKSTETVPISDGEQTRSNAQNKLSESTVIERFIPPHGMPANTPKRQLVCTYAPENSLLHKVTLYKEQSTYAFYEAFAKAAKMLWDRRGQMCEYVEFFSYSPQYNQLSGAQLSYYLWWRENVRAGVFIKTNISYVDLYYFELINCADEQNAEYCRDMMVSVLLNYSGLLGGARSKYIRRIIDFGLVHKLPPPKCSAKILPLCTGALKEYFVRIPGNTYEGWAKTLLEYCCSYDFKTSKFATSENIGLFETHVQGAVCEVVKKLSQSGKILSGLPFGDCKICAPVFEGAVCTTDNKYIAEVEYCSFSRSHELRFLIGDAVKYAENKIRAHISVKSRLSVYSLPSDICEAIDLYFAEALPVPRRAVQKQERREEYDVLYDLPKTKLNLSNADKIEKASWEVTRELAADFDVQEPMAMTCELQTCAPSCDEDTLTGALGEYAFAVRQLKKGNIQPLHALARQKGQAAEALVDSINEIAVNIIGDIIIEENDGAYTFVEDYSDMIGE